MKKLLPYIVIFAAAFAFAKTVRAAESPVVTIDLYGNVFLNGQNTNRQIGDFARDPANFALAPQIDAAVRDAALAARTKITADIQAAQAAATAEKNAAIAAAEQARDSSIAAKEAEKVAAIAANAADLAAKTARVAALEQHVAALAAYIATLRQQITDAGGVSLAPPAAP